MTVSNKLTTINVIIKNLNHYNQLINDLYAVVFQLRNATLPQVLKDKVPFELVDRILNTGNTGLKLCPETHPYAYKNGTSCCGAPGFAVKRKNSKIPDYFDYGNFLSLQWQDTSCEGDSINCPGIGGGCEDSKSISRVSIVLILLPTCISYRHISMSIGSG